MVREKPALTLLSGLAAGVLGGGWIGELAGRNRLITFDIGGTSADIGIVVDGVFAETDARSTSIAGFPLLMPMIDIHTIGAGGGSIAHVDRGGAFKVGPRSAGAVPGPAAYGRGGELPTVTDANVVLGRLDPNGFLGGGMTLDAQASLAVISRLAEQLGLPVNETAEGVLTIINSNMANAIRSRTVQKGIDPRTFALVAFGGAGPLHGAEVAAMLGIPEVIVPPYPGITSAMGLLTTDIKYDAIRTQFQVSGAVDLARLNADCREMEGELAAQFEADHIDASLVGYERIGDLRYVGQGYELKIAIPGGTLDAGASRRSVGRLPQGACGRIRPRLPPEPDRDRQCPRQRARRHAQDRRNEGPQGRLAGGGADPHRPKRLPRQGRVEELRHAGLPARQTARGQANRRPCHHPAEGFHHRGAARRDSRRARIGKHH